MKLTLVNTCRSFNKRSSVTWNFPTDSFKAYMMPETTATTTIEASIQHHCDEVNRTKFTRERKLQLQQLLGSSAEHTFDSPTDYSDEAHLNATPRLQQDGVKDDSGMDSDEGSYRTMATLHSTHDDGVLTDSEWDKDEAVYSVSLTTASTTTTTMTTGYRKPIQDMVEKWYTSKVRCAQPDDSDYMTADPLLLGDTVSVLPGLRQTHTADRMTPPAKQHVPRGQEALQLFDPVKVKKLLDTNDQKYSHTDKPDHLETSILLLTREHVPMTHSTREYSF
ncbi:uncharacterized protein LOC121374072 [Gigantopelta aegis]|uniref:uncharacterized protein LOC121374072 n=1 Tax=Gigantopelta aegis TaxID=1735272 RepID=UPI001B8899AB|nr:uncharacterized protein LOC121374072 [Gigantopelta aegis]